MIKDIKYKNVILLGGLLFGGMFFIVSYVSAAGGISFGVCGDGICQSDETTSSCAIDCNPCGDKFCDDSIGENPITCSLDCIGPVCGDGNCDEGETFENCDSDCSAPSTPPVPDLPSPSCENVTIHAGESSTCSIKIENTQIFPITSVVARVETSKDINRVGNTDSWNCMSTENGIKCDKNYNPYLPAGQIEYLELTMTGDRDGQYKFKVDISGKGQQKKSVTYTSSETVSTVENSGSNFN